MANGGGEFEDAGEHPSAQSLGGDITEEAFRHVGPGGRDGCEMHNEAGMLGQFHSLNAISRATRIQLSTLHAQRIVNAVA